MIPMAHGVELLGGGPMKPPGHHCSGQDSIGIRRSPRKLDSDRRCELDFPALESGSQVVLAGILLVPLQKQLRLQFVHCVDFQTFARCFRLCRSHLFLQGSDFWTDDLSRCLRLWVLEKARSKTLFYEPGKEPDSNALLAG